jgi:hypothetical protein
VVSTVHDRSTNHVVQHGQHGLDGRLPNILAESPKLTRAALRDSLRVKNEPLGEVLEALERAGRLCRTPAGWQRRNGSIEGARSRSL